VVGVGDGRMAGECRLDVALHAGQVPHQAADVEVAQHPDVPLLVAQRAQQGVEGVGGPAERLDRGDLGWFGHRSAGQTGRPRRREHPLAQPGRQRRGRMGGHDDSSSWRSSMFSSLASARRTRDLPEFRR
jgi:hypothetical protein